MNIGDTYVMASEGAVKAIGYADRKKHTQNHATEGEICKGFLSSGERKAKAIRYPGRVGTKAMRLLGWLKLLLKMKQ